MKQSLFESVLLVIALLISFQAGLHQIKGVDPIKSSKRHKKSSNHDGPCRVVRTDSEMGKKSLSSREKTLVIMAQPGNVPCVVKHRDDHDGLVLFVPARGNRAGAH